MTGLEDGWGPSTPVDDTLLRTHVIAFADWMVAIGRAVGAPVLDDDDVGAVNLGATFPFVNGAVARRPLGADEWAALVERLRALCRDVPWVVFSGTPTPPLHALGLDLMGHPPCMFRPAGGEPPARPTGLEIEEVHDEAGLARFCHALRVGYPAPDLGRFEDPGILDLASTRLWVGSIDGEPVATSAVNLSGGTNHVEWISTVPAARGRGVGSALTWMATQADPTLPAALIASDDGQPVYERMGYLRLARWTLWSAPPSS